MGVTWSPCFIALFLLIADPQLLAAEGLEYLLGR